MMFCWCERLYHEKKPYDYYLNPIMISMLDTWRINITHWINKVVPETVKDWICYCPYCNSVIGKIYNVKDLVYEVQEL